MKELSVVILNWNGKQLMEKFLPSVVKYTPKTTAEVVVADNGSNDGSLEMLQKKFPSVRIISFDHNYGFAEGYNKALLEVDSKYSVLLNSDVEVTDGWTVAPIEAMNAENSIVCVQPKILAERNKGYFEYAGAAGGFIDKYGYPFCRGRVLQVIEKDSGQYDTVSDLLWASGACLFVRTDVFKLEGGLDGNFFAHQEEIDMCWRLRSRGYRIICMPRSVIYHYGGATLDMENPRKTFLNFRNSLLTIYKNLPEKDLRHSLFVRFLLDNIAALKFLMTGHLQNANAVFKARKEFRKLVPQYAIKRKENLEKSTGKAIPEVLQKSLIVSFYFGGKKKYTDFK